MARGKIVDLAVYQQLVEAFQQSGRGNISEVCRITGISRETVTKAWKSGWPARELEPIRDLPPGMAFVSLATQKVAYREVLATQEVARQPEISIKSATQITAYQELPTQGIAYLPDSGASSTPAPIPETPDVTTARQTHTPTLPPQLAIAPVPADPLGTEIARMQGDIAKVLAGENKTLNYMGTAVEGATASVVNMLVAYKGAVEKMRAQIDDATELGLKSSNPGATLKAVNKLVRMMPQIMATLKGLMEMRRLHLGVPQSITESRVTGGSSEDGDARTARLGRFLPHAAERGPVIDAEFTAQPYEGEESADQAVNTGT